MKRVVIFASTKTNYTMKNSNKAVTKKIGVGHYLHIASGLHITFCMGEQTGWWNIYNDADLISEWQVSIPTKWQCIEKIENYILNN